MTEVDISIIKAMGKRYLNVTKVAKDVFMHRNTVVYHLRKIKDETGLDAHNPRELVKLLEMVEQGGQEG